MLITLDDDAGAPENQGQETSDGRHVSVEYGGVWSWKKKTSEDVGDSNPITIKGQWDASSGLFPDIAGLKAGWAYIVGTPGTVDNIVFLKDDLLIALVDSPSTTVFDTNWYVRQSSNQLVDTDRLVDGAVTTIKLGNRVVSYGKIQNVSASFRVLGRHSQNAGPVEELNATQLREILNIEEGATAGAAFFGEGTEQERLDADESKRLWYQVPGDSWWRRVANTWQFEAGYVATNQSSYINKKGADPVTDDDDFGNVVEIDDDLTLHIPTDDAPGAMVTLISGFDGILNVTGAPGVVIRGDVTVADDDALWAICIASDGTAAATWVLVGATAQAGSSTHGEGTEAQRIAASSTIKTWYQTPEDTWWKRVANSWQLDSAPVSVDQTDYRDETGSAYTTDDDDLDDFVEIDQAPTLHIPAVEGVGATVTFMNSHTAAVAVAGVAGVTLIGNANVEPDEALQAVCKLSDGSAAATWWLLGGTA